MKWNLFKMMKAAWASNSIEVVHKLVESMPHRIEAVLLVEVGTPTMI